MIDTYHLSAQRACQLLGLQRASFAYYGRSQQDMVLRPRLRELAQVQAHYGSQHLYPLLRREGWMNCSRPGKPTANPHMESFNSRFRDECLNVPWFLSLADAQEKIEHWRAKNKMASGLTVRYSYLTLDALLLADPEELGVGRK